MLKIDPQESERLGRAMAERAANREGFIGHAFAVWRVHHDQQIEETLHCDSAATWRLAVTPIPAPSRFVEQTMQLAQAHGADARALIGLLRWVEARQTLRGASQGDGLLKAALDTDGTEKGS